MSTAPTLFTNTRNQPSTQVTQGLQTLAPANATTTTLRPSVDVREPHLEKETQILNGKLDSNPGFLMSEVDPQTPEIKLFATMLPNPKVQESIKDALQGFSDGQRPTLASGGTSGSYILEGSQGPTAIFKPIDEEQYAPNNPRQRQGCFGSETLRPGVKSGESTLREVAAYLLDHEGFSGVPATSLVEVRHEQLPSVQISANQVVDDDFACLLSDLIQIEPATSKKCDDKESVYSDLSISTINSEFGKKAPKVGSFQKFVENNGIIEDFSSDLFSKDEIHKIAILDMRMFNLDRNSENILVQRPSTGEHQYTLIPIDHGLTLPDSLELCSYDVIWLGFDQASEPFSQRTLDYIQRLDVDADIEMLESSFKFRPVCLRNMKISTLLLQKGAANGLTLAQIGQLICRPDEDDSEPSTLEKIVMRAEQVSAQKGRNSNLLAVTKKGLPKASSTQDFQQPQAFGGELKLDFSIDISEKPGRDRLYSEVYSSPSKADMLEVSDPVETETSRIEESKEPSLPALGKQISFSEACKQQKSQTKVWTKINLSNEATTAKRREQLAANRAQIRGGPHDAEFFAAFIPLLEEAISQVKSNC